MCIRDRYVFEYAILTAGSNSQVNTSMRIKRLKESKQAKEDWVVVIGHHPIYAETSKDDSERSDMQKRLDPILRKHKVDI